MSRRVRSINEYIEIYRNQVVAKAGEISDFNPGSIHDILSGAAAISLNEVAEILIDRFRKTNFSTSSGQDLEDLAIDRFGPTFSRPGATRASVSLKFSRASSNAGVVTIPEGTEVTTAPDAEGNVISYTTDQMTMLGPAELMVMVDASSTATGEASRVGANTLRVIERPLTDQSVTVTNPLSSTGGSDAEDDQAYLETIRSRIQQFAGATETAIVGAILALPDIDQATPVLQLVPVIPYDIANSRPVANAEWFRYPRPVIYVAGPRGSVAPKLVTEATTAIANVRAYGVRIEIEAAQTRVVNWSATATINAGTDLANDNSPVVAAMKDYIDRVLGIGQSFDPSVAEPLIVAQFTDLTALDTANPAIHQATATQKLVAGEVELV